MGDYKMRLVIHCQFGTRRLNIMSSSVIAGVFVCLALLLLPFVLSVYRRRRVLRDIPGLEETFILGHAKHFHNKPSAEILKTLQRAFKELGTLWKVFLVHETLVVTSDPKMMEVVLSSQKLVKKSIEYKLLERWLGDGLLLSTGKKWLSRRRIITPTFHFKILDDFVQVFDKNSSILVDILGKKTPGEPVEVHDHVALAALDVICETSMGISVNAQINSGSDFVMAVKELSLVIHMRMFDAVLRNNITYPFTKAARMESRALKVIHDFSDSVIVSRKNELLAQQQRKVTTGDEADDGVGIRKKQALLDVLLQATVDGKPLSNSDIREEVDTFVFEGHDTTASAISFALYSIAKHPEVQQKLIKEIHEVIGENKNTPITMKMLSDLQYMDLVLKEVLRLYPSVPLHGRYIEEDVVINNVKLPAGCNLIVSSWAMHRNPELFPDPEQFRPERFVKDDGAGVENPYSFVPFSAGPRNCIGQKFATLEMKSMVSKVLRYFEITVDPGYKEPVLVAEIILKPENGIVLNLKPRL